MNIYSTDSRGTLSGKGNIMRVDNALVEEVVIDGRRGGYILISYGVEGQNDMIFIELLRLNIGPNTIITDQFGESLSLRNIREGMWIDAEFSSAMTRSIPPQSTAFRIIVQLDDDSVSITTDRVAMVDVNNNFLYTGNPNDMNDQMKFVISNATLILDRNGNPIRLTSLRPGQMVRIEHANFQTLSIPPQTTAFRVQLL